MYTASPQSDYYYTKGINPWAIAAFVPAAAVSLTFALVPAFSRVAPFGWFIGCALSAVIYYPLAKAKIRIREEAPVRA